MITRQKNQRQVFKNTLIPSFTCQDPALVVEPMSSMTSTQSSRPAARSSATLSGENVRSRDSGIVNLYLRAYYGITV